MSNVLRIVLFAILAAVVFIGFFSLHKSRLASRQRLLSGSTANGVVTHTESAAYYTVEVRYPDRTPLFTWWSPTADAKARDAMERFLADDIAQFKQNIDAEHISGPEKESLDASGRKYSYAAAYKQFVSAHGNLVSYEYDIAIDTGGAHPNSFFKTFVFDSSGTALKLGDLFLPGTPYMPPIASTTESQVLAQLSQKVGDEASGSMFREGLAPTDANYENFIIDGTDLVILIPPYQAAAYAAGSFQIRIPLSQLSDILLPKWK